jgi:hypothetical protein
LSEIVDGSFALCDGDSRATRADSTKEVRADGDMATAPQTNVQTTKLRMTWFDTTANLLANWSRVGSRHRRQSLWHISGVCAERLELRALCTLPPVDFITAFNAGVGLYSSQTSAAESAYDTTIAGAFDQMWLDAATVATDAAADMDPSGGDWSDIAGDIDPTDSSAMSTMLGAIPTGLDAIKTIIAADLPNLTLPSSLRIPAQLEWTQLDEDTWDVNGSEITDWPFVQDGVTWTNSESDFVQVRVRRTPSNDFDLTGRIQNWDYRISPPSAGGNGETCVLFDLNTRVTLGSTPSATGQLSLDYHRRDENATGETSLLTELKLRNVDITSGAPETIKGTFGVRSGRNTLGFDVEHSPIFGSTKAAGHIWGEGSNYRIEISGGADTQTSQAFLGGMFELSSTSGAANSLFGVGFYHDFGTDLTTGSLQYASPKTLVKASATYSDSGPYGGENSLSASVIRRFPPSPSNPGGLYAQLGINKNLTTGVLDVRRETFPNQPNLRWQYLSRGFVVLPEPNIQGPYGRLYLAVPINLTIPIIGVRKTLILAPAATANFQDGTLGADFFFNLTE